MATVTYEDGYRITITDGGAEIRERYSEVEAEPVPASNPTEWFIDIGSFFDRFGASKMAILTSGDADVKAILVDVTARRWIDLKRADVAEGLDTLIGLGLITTEQKSAILTTPVSPEENLVLRRLYFS